MLPSEPTCQPQDVLSSALSQPPRRPTSQSRWAFCFWSMRESLFPRSGPSGATCAPPPPPPRWRCLVARLRATTSRQAAGRIGCATCAVASSQQRCTQMHSPPAVRRRRWNRHGRPPPGACWAMMGRWLRRPKQQCRELLRRPRRRRDESNPLPRPRRCKLSRLRLPRRCMPSRRRLCHHARHQSRHVHQWSRHDRHRLRHDRRQWLPRRRLSAATPAASSGRWRSSACSRTPPLRRPPRPECQRRRRSRRTRS